MRFHVEFLKEAEIAMIQDWWKASGEIGPEKEMMPLDCSFLVYEGETPLACVTAFLTTSPLVWLDNLIGNPAKRGTARKEAIEFLLHSIETWAKSIGKTRLFCMSMHDKTARRYEQLGFQTTLKNVTTLTKGII